MKKTKTNTYFELITLLNETHNKMYEIMEWCERLQPVKLDNDWSKGTMVDLDDHSPITVDLTDEEEMMKTKLFRLKDIDEMTDFNDQHSRSILKDIRKYIRDLEQ